MKLILWNSRNPTEEYLIFIVPIFAFLSLACFSLVFCHKLVYHLLQNPFITAALGRIETEVLLHQGWPEIDLFLQIVLTGWAHSHIVLTLLPSCCWGFCNFILVTIISTEISQEWKHIVTARDKVIDYAKGDTPDLYELFHMNMFSSSEADRNNVLKIYSNLSFWIYICDWKYCILHPSGNKSK